MPAGLCYQRLSSPDGGFFVHGLVAVHLRGAWHRQDPRGNKPGVDAQFSLDQEQLAWIVDRTAGEYDYPQLYRSIAPEVAEALGNADDVLTCSLPSRLSSVASTGQSETG